MIRSKIVPYDFRVPEWHRSAFKVLIPQRMDGKLKTKINPRYWKIIKTRVVAVFSLWHEKSTFVCARVVCIYLETWKGYWKANTEINRGIPWIGNHVCFLYSACLYICIFIYFLVIIIQWYEAKERTAKIDFFMLPVSIHLLLININ